MEILQSAINNNDADSRCSLLLVQASTANAFTMQDAKTVLSSTSTFFKTAMASVSSRQRRDHVISSQSGSGDISTTSTTEAPTTTFGENGDGRDECRALCQTVADQTNAVSPGAGDGVLEQCYAYCAVLGEMGDGGVTTEPAPTYETFGGDDADSETKPECVASGVGSNATPSKEAFLSDFTEILEVTPPPPLSSLARPMNFACAYACAVHV